MAKATAVELPPIKDEWSRKSEGYFVPSAVKSRIKHIRGLIDTIAVEMKRAPDDVRMLDLGCGDGTLLGHLHRDTGAFQANLAGVDANILAIEWAGHKVPHAELIIHDLREPLTKSRFTLGGKFDVVIVSHVLHLLEKDGWYTLMETAAKMVRPNGRVIVVAPLGDEPFIKTVMIDAKLNPMHALESSFDSYIIGKK